MKKAIAIALLLSVVCSSHAAVDERLWSSLLNTTVTDTLGIEGAGVGAGWYTQVINLTDSSQTAGKNDVSLGWVSPSYWLNLFQFSATEEDDVVLRLYNNANAGMATFFIDSQTLSLLDLNPTDDPTYIPGLNDLNVDFNFSGQSWQAVPEPATALLFGIGGLGAFIVRRNKKKAQEEADA